MNYCKCGCGTQCKRIYIHGHNGRLKEPLYGVDDNGCWLWLHSICEGYGRVSVNGKQIGAHVFFYEKYKGSVPKGFEVDHLCRVRKCVNPDHLEAVPHAENTRRGNCTKLTTEQVKEIRRRVVELKESRKSVAKKFDVHFSTVSYIVSGKLWGGA